MPISLCNRSDTSSCFDAERFETREECDAVRIKMRRPSRYVCKAGDRVILRDGEADNARLHAPREGMPFASAEGIGQFEAVPPMPACSVDGEYCDPARAKLGCCEQLSCVQNRCVATLPSSAATLRTRAEDSGVFAAVAGQEASLAQIFAAAPTPMKGLRTAASTTHIDLGTLSQLRGDSVRCFPEAEVGGRGWAQGPHRCHRTG